MGQVCERCGFKENPHGMSFCGRCGAPLGRQCLRCGLHNSPGRSVCERCEALLPEASHLEPAMEEALALETARRYLPAGLIEKLARSAEGPWGERRDVTVLFADLCGYTALSEAFDPETVYGLLNAVLDVLLKEIHRFEGVVNQFYGDGLMATFGMSLSHENDPERAVRAALNMQRALLKLNREIEPRLGVAIQMRTGINHGEVIAGSIGSEDRMDFTIIGSAVNLAARLERAAEPGSVLVSQSVHQRAHRLFEFEAQPLLELKGIAEPVASWVALGPRAQPAPVRGLEGLSARMIGRDKELAAFQRAARDLVTGSTGRLILITGEAGIGKSRLVSEFKARLVGEPVIVLEGAGQAHTATTAYSLFASLLENHLKLPVAEAEDRRAALDTWLAERLPSRASTVGLFIAHLLDLPMTDDEAAALGYLEPSQLQRQIFMAVRDLLLCEVDRQAMVIILEDLHWIDSASLEQLMFLAPLVEQSPLILCGISRPLSGQAAPRLKDLGATRMADRFLLIELNPLSANETDVLLADLLAVPAFSDALRQAILGEAGGNPFFLEEFLRMLIDEGYIALEEGEGGEESWWVAAREVDLATLRVPQTLQELIVTRVDRLPVGPQHVLACASVLGQSFNETLLRGVIDSEHRPALDTHLQYLHAYDLIAPHVELAETWAFRHVVTQEAVYASLMGETQREYHRRAGRSLEDLYPDQLNEHLEQLAYHYGHSGLAIRAVPYLTRVAIRDARRYANSEALQHFDEALELLPSLTPASQPDFALKVALGRGDLFLLVGRYGDARAEYWRGLGLLHGGHFDSPLVTTSLAMKRKMGQCRERQGDYTETMLWYQLALADIEDVERPSAEHALEAARLYSDVGWLHFRRNELDDAESWLGKALQGVEGTDHRQEIATIHNRMGGIWYRRGDLDRASQEVAAAVALYEYMDDLQGVARGYANLGVLALSQSRWAEAAGHFRRSLETHERTGDVQGEIIACGNLGVVYTNLGDIPQAKEFLERSLQGAVAAADSFNAAQAYKNLGRAFVYAEEWPLATDYLQKALAIYEELKDGELVADTCALLGEAALGSGDLVRAQTLAQQALDMAFQKDGGREEREARAWRLMGMMQRALGHFDSAMEALLKCREMFEQLGDRLELAQVLLELALLHQALGQAEEARRLAEESHVICQAIGASIVCRRAAKLLASLES